MYFNYSSGLLGKTVSYVSELEMMAQKAGRSYIFCNGRPLNNARWRFSTLNESVAQIAKTALKVRGGRISISFAPFLFARQWRGATTCRSHQWGKCKGENKRKTETKKKKTRENTQELEGDEKSEKVWHTMFCSTRPLNFLKDTTTKSGASEGEENRGGGLYGWGEGAADNLRA